jgi:hypothetical protein
MEELQDAIEDAQYMNAMQDSVPKPTKEWRKPTPEEIQKYVSRLMKDNPKALEAEGICTGSLGFYMVCISPKQRCCSRETDVVSCCVFVQFLKFISEQGQINASRFLFDVAAFRVSL